MSIFFQKIDRPNDMSYSYHEWDGNDFLKEYNETYFEFPYHYHTEIEIFLIVKGQGKQFIGETISTFQDGTLLMLGKNLPHGWKNEKKHKKDKSFDHIALVQFDEEFAGKDFFQLPEMRFISSLFKKAVHGLNITGKTRDIVADNLVALMKKKDASNIIELLSILDIIAKSEEVERISKSAFLPNYSGLDHEKINKVYRYIFDNFSEDIHLEKIASLVNMSKSGFCHYFLKRTGKNFSQVVNEIRIKNACRLLTETSMSVSDICYQNGYNCLSNFNKQFHKITNTTPLKYKREFIK